MAATANTTTAADINFSLDREFTLNFQGDSDRLQEILGIASVETVAAGTALYQLSVTGSLNNSKTDPSSLASDSGTVTLGSSSGTAYVEGDEVALSKYSVTKTPIAVASIVPYRRRTTAAAVLKSGYDVAVLRTDAKMLSNVRGAVVSDFFTNLAKGTGTSDAGTGLQSMLANMDAALANKMEDNGDEADGVVHFVNRLDAAAYIGTQPVTTQTVFGMTYLEDFLGIERVFLTNKVTKGTAWVTPTDNLHIFGIDFSALGSMGLSYEVSDGGLVGVHHEAEYGCVSGDTHVVLGMKLFPEVTDYMVKGTIAVEA